MFYIKMIKKGRKKKMNKKILSVLMALLLAFLSLPVNKVFAADDEGTITIFDHPFTYEVDTRVSDPVMNSMLLKHLILN